jgi:hypothetical protein
MRVENTSRPSDDWPAPSNVDRPHVTAADHRTDHQRRFGATPDAQTTALTGEENDYEVYMDYARITLVGTPTLIEQELEFVNNVLPTWTHISQEQRQTYTYCVRDIAEMSRTSVTSYRELMQQCAEGGAMHGDLAERWRKL